MHAISDILFRPDIQVITERAYQLLDRSGGPDACWPWVGPTNNKGYGYLSLGTPPHRIRVYSHRLFYVLTNGPLEGVFKVSGRAYCINATTQFVAILGTFSSGMTV